jgi:hypothetical protein
LEWKEGGVIVFLTRIHKSTNQRRFKNLGNGHFESQTVHTRADGQIIPEFAFQVGSNPTEQYELRMTLEEWQVLSSRLEAMIADAKKDVQERAERRTK